MTADNPERAVYYTQREDAEVAGAIRLRSQSQGEDAVSGAMWPPSADYFVFTVRPRGSPEWIPRRYSAVFIALFGFGVLLAV